MITIAKEFIYPGWDFEEINGWCHYNAADNILLIDSYHPSYSKFGNEGIFRMAKAFQEMLEHGKGVY